MSFAPISGSPYPNVPALPGVPQLVRAPGIPAIPPALSGAELVVSDAAVLLRRFFGASQWGIFLDDQPVAIADSVLSVDFRAEARISNYQIERGGFESYDKVQLPFDGRVSFSIGGSSTFGAFSGGSQANQEAFLAAVDVAQKSLQLYNLVTPAAVYADANIIHYDYRRERVGAGLLIVDVWIEEVRQTATSSFTQTQAPEGAAQQSGGTVSPQAVPDNSAAGGRGDPGSLPLPPPQPTPATPAPAPSNVDIAPISAPPGQVMPSLTPASAIDTPLS